MISTMDVSICVDVDRNVLEFHDMKTTFAFGTDSALDSGCHVMTVL